MPRCSFSWENGYLSISDAIQAHANKRVVFRFADVQALDADMLDYHYGCVRKIGTGVRCTSNRAVWFNIFEGQHAASSTLIAPRNKARLKNYLLKSRLGVESRDRC